MDERTVVVFDEIGRGTAMHALHPETLLVKMPDDSIEAESSFRILPGFPTADIPPELGARRVMSKLGLSDRELQELVGRLKERRAANDP